MELQTPKPRKRVATQKLNIGSGGAKKKSRVTPLSGFITPPATPVEPSSGSSSGLFSRPSDRYVSSLEEENKSLKDEISALRTRLEDLLMASAKDKGEVNALKATLTANEATLKFFMDQFSNKNK